MAATGNGFFASTNTGQTWELKSAQSVGEVVSSFDGTVLAARSDYVTVSTNSGIIWLDSPASAYGVSSLALSADGTKLYRSEIGGPRSGGNIWMSTNLGATWVSTSAPTTNWYEVCCAANGAKLAAVHGTTQVHVSTDFGNTWTETNISGATNLYTVAWSADGGVLLTCANYVFRSTNSGLSWEQTGAPYANWLGIACSADGSKLTAVGLNYPNYIVYSSTNSGVSWVSNNLPNLYWSHVSESADGGVRFLSAAYTGDIFKSQMVYPPKLKVSNSTGLLVLSWIVPSTSFILQQNADLSAPNWVNVAAPPVVNYATLTYEVSVTPPAGPMFYRLVSQ